MSATIPEPPVVFVSYSWASPEHKAWVADLSRRLRANGVDVYLDRWSVNLGSDLNLFMERFADPSARVLVVLSDDYGPKADRRAEQASGVGTETTILSASVYEDLGGNRVIPVVPDSGTVSDPHPITPVYLRGRVWIDFRSDHEAAYEQLLRDLHGVPVEATPSLGRNPFHGTTEAQARALIRNDPARWADSRMAGQLEINLDENSGRFSLGSGEARFDLFMDSLGTRVRHYRDYLGHIGRIGAAADNPQRFQDLPSLPMSNRVETTAPGDVLVMMNHSGYWALMIHDESTTRRGPNGDEAVVSIRFTIATDRTANLTLSNLPAHTTASTAAQ